MAPVNTSASPADVDNEVTAELPVLDIAAYEATLNEHTDSWSVPAEALTPVTPNKVEATLEMPVVRADATAVMPTIPAYDLDHSGTHEMPAMPKAPRKAVKPTVVPTASVTAPLVPTPELIAPVIAQPSPDVDEWRVALAAAGRRIEELNERARIADAERGVAVARANAESAQLREQLAAHLESLQTAKERLAVQRADEPELEDQLFARGDRIVALEKDLAVRAAELDRTRDTLAESQKRAESLECDRMNLRATVARRESQIAMLEADLAARQQREAQLSSRLADALASTDPFVPQLRGELDTRDEQVRTLKAELELARANVSEKDDDLQVAEESIRNLEIEVRDKSTKLEEASGTVEEWRAVIAESQRSILQRDSRIHQLESDLEKRVTQVSRSTDQTGEEIALEGPARVLIRTDGNTDFVHVLGRRTRIGRGPDNELVLDTKHISRYHAVLLAGPVHTSIEDLNSTNGVFVNNRRVARQVLKDGDRVTVGRTQFRYTVRD